MTYAERFQDISVSQLNTEGFEQLTPRQKFLAYYLAQAGLWGRAISLDQGCEHNLALFRTLTALYSKLAVHRIPPGASAQHPLERLRLQVHDCLYLLFAHNGVYHSTTGEKLQLGLVQADLEQAREQAGEEVAALVDTLQSLWFSQAIKPWRTVQTDGVDVVASSGANFYQGLCTNEVLQWRQANHPEHGVPTGDDDAQVPPYGFNERLSKNPDGTVRQEVIWEQGLYGPYLTQSHLKQVHQRIAALDLPRTMCFVTPILTREDNSVTLHQLTSSPP